MSTSARVKNNFGVTTEKIWEKATHHNDEIGMGKTTQVIINTTDRGSQGFDLADELVPSFLENLVSLSFFITVYEGDKTFIFLKRNVTEITIDGEHDILGLANKSREAARWKSAGRNGQ